MKNNAIFWVLITTLLLISITIMAALDFPFNWVFYLTVIGEGMMVYMVYAVLTDEYHSDKTFDDFYEDHPIGKQKDL